MTRARSLSSGARPQERRGRSVARVAGLGLGALVLGLAPDAPARTPDVAVVTDPRVAQYREAQAAAGEQLHGQVSEFDSGAAESMGAFAKASPDVILAVGQKSLEAARAAHPDTPTVYCMVLGRNAGASAAVTGVTLEVSVADQLSRLKQVHPGARRLGVLYDPRTSAQVLAEALRSSSALDLTLVAKPVADAKVLREAVAEIASDIDALWLLPDPRLVTKEVFNYLLVFTLERKIALFGFLDSFTQAGALASVAPDYREIGRRAGRLAWEVAERPAAKRLPMPPPIAGPGALSVNLKTAFKLGIKVSDEAVGLARQVYR